MGGGGGVFGNLQPFLYSLVGRMILIPLLLLSLLQKHGDGK